MNFNLDNIIPSIDFGVLDFGDDIVVEEISSSLDCSLLSAVYRISLKNYDKFLYSALHLTVYSLVLEKFHDVEFCPRSTTIRVQRGSQFSGRPNTFSA